VEYAGNAGPPTVTMITTYLNRTFGLFTALLLVRVIPATPTQRQVFFFMISHASCRFVSFFFSDGCISFTKPDLYWNPLNGNYDDYSGNEAHLEVVAGRNDVIWKYFDAGIESGRYAWFDGSNLLEGPDPGSAGTFVCLYVFSLDLNLIMNFLLGCLGLPCPGLSDLCSSHQLKLSSVMIHYPSSSGAGGNSLV
jgi:hypothetical protein